jgi:hypothetical protein
MEIGSTLCVQYSGCEEQRIFFARVVAAYLMMQYGFFKLMGAQFTMLDSQLDLPLKQVTPFWLTWYYFGMSPTYGTVIALGQIVGGTLLIFRRTALAGAILLAPIVANILLIDLTVIHWPPLFGAVLMAWIVAAVVVLVFLCITENCS